MTYLRYTAWYKTTEGKLKLTRPVIRNVFLFFHTRMYFYPSTSKLIISLKWLTCFKLLGGCKAYMKLDTKSQASTAGTTSSGSPKVFKRISQNGSTLLIRAIFLYCFLALTWNISTYVDAVPQTDFPPSVEFNCAAVHQHGVFLKRHHSYNEYILYTSRKS